MYVAKINDLYLKKYNLTWNGRVETVKLSADMADARVFSNIDWNPETIKSFKRQGFKFYKLSETEVNE